MSMDMDKFNYYLNKLKELKDGWHDGWGKAPDIVFINTFAEYFKEYYNKSLLIPYIYPTFNGGIVLEWSCKPFEASLEVLPNRRSHSMLSYWHSINFVTNGEDAEQLYLDIPNSWIIINNKINKIMEA